jgi:hypothetical protein
MKMDNVFELVLFALTMIKKGELKKGLEYMKFIGKVPSSTVDEIPTYNDILDHIEKDKTTLITILSNFISSVVSLLIKAHFGHPAEFIKDQHTFFW